jgi:hypothetical protein
LQVKKCKKYIFALEHGYMEGRRYLAHDKYRIGLVKKIKPGKGVTKPSLKGRYISALGSF